MKTQKKDFIQLYLDWLKTEMSSKEINGSTEIITPFLDFHNDYIAIYITPHDGGYILTDDGTTISELEMIGCELNTPKRNKVLQTILNGHGVQMEGEELVVQTSDSDFPQKKHSLIQAIINVNDMFMLSQKRVTSMFLEDVKEFFDKNQISNISNVSFAGRSGFQHKFDFALPKTTNNAERLVRLVNNPSKSSTESILFAWNDVQKTREKDAEMLVIMNDQDKEIDRKLVVALKNYGADAVPWSAREQALAKSH